MTSTNLSLLRLGGIATIFRSIRASWVEIGPTTAEIDHRFEFHPVLVAANLPPDRNVLLLTPSATALLVSRFRSSRHAVGVWMNAAKPRIVGRLDTGHEDDE